MLPISHDSSDGEDTDEDVPKPVVPDWAKGPALRAALERQYGMHGQTAMDPDLIFTGDCISLPRDMFVR